MDIGLALFYGSLAHWGPAVAQAPANTVSLPNRCVAATFYMSFIAHVTSSERIEQEKHTKAFDKMLAKSPGSLDIMHEFHKDEEKWAGFVSMVRASLYLSLALKFMCSTSSVRQQAERVKTTPVA
jgi:hypothetical protein